MKDLPCINQYVLGQRLEALITITNNSTDMIFDVSILTHAPRYTCNKCYVWLLNSSTCSYNTLILMLLPRFNTCVTKQTFISLSNNEFNLTHRNISNIHSYYEVNISNNRDELSEKNMSVKLLIIVIIAEALSKKELFNARQMFHLQQLSKFEKIFTSNLESHL